MEDVTIIYRTFHPNTKDIPSSQHHKKPSLKLITCSVTEQTSTDTKKIELTLLVLSDLHGVKLAFNNNATPRKSICT